MTQPPPWNSNVPLPTDNIAKSQGDFLNNFQRLYESWSRDHVSLDAGASFGNHNVARIKEVKTGVNTSVSEIAMYTKRVDRQTDQLFIRNQGNGQEIQYTNWQINAVPPNTIPGPNDTTIIVQTRYFTFLPGGVIIYFGEVIPTFDRFPIFLNPPVCTNISSINLCVIGPQTSNYPSNPSVTVNSDGKAVAVHITTGFDGTGTGIPPRQFYIITGDHI